MLNNVLIQLTGLSSSSNVLYPCTVYGEAHRTTCRSPSTVGGGVSEIKQAASVSVQAPSSVVSPHWLLLINVNKSESCTHTQLRVTVGEMNVACWSREMIGNRLTKISFKML